MACAKIGAGPLNPFNKELTCKTGTVATIVLALSTIAVVAGVLALLASQGIHVGPFNALSHVGVGGGAPLTGLGGVLLLASIAWFASRKKQAEVDGEDKTQESDEKLRVFEESSKQKLPKVDEERLARVFPKAVNQQTQTNGFIIGKKQEIIHMTEEATLDDIKGRLSILIGEAPPHIHIIYQGSELTEWKDVPNYEVVNVLIRRGVY